MPGGNPFSGRRKTLARFGGSRVRSEGDNPFGRIDLHFGSSVVHGVLIVERDLADQDLHGLVRRIDDDLVWTADQPREDFLVTVYRGTESGVISDRDGDEDDEHEHGEDADDDED